MSMIRRSAEMVMIVESADSNWCDQGVSPKYANNYLNRLGARQENTDILPPIKSLWSDPSFHKSDPYFGGQRVGELYIDLARQLPERYVTPFTTLAIQALNLVLARAVVDVQAGNEAGLEQRIAGWLTEADGEVRKRIDFGRFDE